MADSVVYGPGSCNSAWNAWRSRISPAVSNKPPAINEQEDGGSEIDGLRVKGWALGSSTLAAGTRASSALVSGNGTGAAAALWASRDPAQDAELANIRGVWRRCLAAAGRILHSGGEAGHASMFRAPGASRVVYNPCVVYNHGRISLCHLGSWFAGRRYCLGASAYHSRASRSRAQRSPFRRQDHLPQFRLGQPSPPQGRSNRRLTSRSLKSAGHP